MLDDETKIIYDAVHKTIKIQGIIRDLIDTPEVQRLSGIKQLGLAYLVFPGANHTRIEHSIGTSFVARRISERLEINDDEKMKVQIACLLHDVGHGPYSHTLESVLNYRLKIDHMDVTKKIITGEYNILIDEPEKTITKFDRIPSILNRYGYDPKEIAELVEAPPFKDVTLESFFYEPPREVKYPKKYLAQIVHSAVDADQIDYLLRDAHYTGVAHGIIDVERLISTFTIFNNQLCIDKKGVSAIEGMLVARGLMYSSVYFHKTVRIAELMISRAVDRAFENNPEATASSDIQKLTDTELFNWLKEQGDYQREIAMRIKYRRLYKKVWSKSLRDLTDDEKNALLKLTDHGKVLAKEDELCHRANLPEGNIIIDLPLPELLISEPRIDKVNFKIVDENSLLSLTELTPLANALRTRQVADWAVMIATLPEHKDVVSKLGEKYVFD